MNKSLMTRLLSLLSRRQLKERLARVAMALSCVAVFCVTYMLVAPVLTEEWPTVCGKEEHVHTDECYTIELREIPMDPQPETETEAEPKTEGHVHDESCYEEVTHRELVCDLAESEGHTHDDSCTETHRELVCGEAESEGHHHSSGCYETEEVLTCSDDSEDHEHDSSCYETIEPLTCSESESDGHTHDDSCYEEETVYTCGETESEGHTHDDSCYEEIITRELTCGLEETRETEEPAETETGAEPQYEEVRILTCGKEEHTHEDSCYQQETNEARYFCGLDEHTHTDSCYFESGDLRCTIPEHTHTDECQVRPTQLPEIADEFVCGVEEHAHTDECYTLDEATGELVLTCEKTEHVHTDECLTQVQPEIDPEAVELNETFTAESEDGAVILTLQVNGLVHLPEAEEPEAADAIDETDMIDETDAIDEPQETGFQLVLTESEDLDAYEEYTELASEEGEVLVMGVLDYTLTYNGQSVDLTECEIVAEVAPTEAFQQFMDDPQTLGLMTVTNELGEEETAAEEDVEILFTAYTTQRRGTVAYVAAQDNSPDPTFTVQYYANIDRVVLRNWEGALDEVSVVKKATDLPLVNTNGGSTAKNSNLGGKTPTNQTEFAKSPNENSIGKLTLLKDPNSERYNVETKPVLTEIYKSEKLTYKRAPGLMYFNIVNNNANSEYTLSQIWVLNSVEGETDDAKAARAAGTDESGWTVYPYSSDIRFTNRPQTAEANQGYILIDENAIIRLVYDAKPSTEDMPVNFYDYDISDGLIHRDKLTAAGQVTSKQKENPEKTTWYINAEGQGINSGSNYTGSGNKLGFGMSISSNIANARWNGYQFNQGNTQNFMKATYGLVTGMDGKGHIQYDSRPESKIDAPKLFNEPNDPDKQVTGKTSYDNGEYSLKFNRVGDTYTLTAVNNTNATNLHQFTNIEYYVTWADPKYYKYLHTNNFWPMDSAPSWGTDGHDLKFGKDSLASYRKYANGNLPTSDDKKDHNPYFGMQYAVTFDLTSNYVGPLEYYFFGDDDMWVFLSEYEEETKTYKDPKLVCDIGGVHTSLGQYVNLWDYIDRSDLLENGEPIRVQKLDENGQPIPLLDKNGQPIVVDGEVQYQMTDKTKTYALSFFYTERGASGSTCWMQFTLPTVVGVDLDSFLDGKLDEETGAVSIEKRLEGIDHNEWFEFTIEGLADNFRPTFLLRDANGTLLDNEEAMKENGYILGGTDNHFKIRAGDVLSLTEIPKDTKLTVTEIGQEGSEMSGYRAPKIAVDGVELETSPDKPTAVDITIQANKRTQIIYTNISAYELPATGGSGTTIWYTMGALSLLGAAFLMYKQLTKKEDEAWN